LWHTDETTHHIQGPTLLTLGLKCTQRYSPEPVAIGVEWSRENNPAQHYWHGPSGVKGITLFVEYDKL
jgi:hypothetical protein